MKKKNAKLFDIIGISCGVFVLLVGIVSAIIAHMPAKAVGAVDIPSDAVTLTGTANGRNGPVSVEIRATADKLYSIRVTEQTETESIGGVAAEELPGRIYETQSLMVDGVSGATITSDAIKDAVRAALLSGGFDPTVYEVEAHYQAEALRYDVTEADVIVVGAGGAGMTAAYTAREQGASVILLEKSGVVGGNSLCAQMGINAADSQVQQELGMNYATAENLKAAHIRYGGRENVVDAYVASSGETVDWLRDTLNINFTYGGRGEIDPADPLASVGEDHPSGSELFMVRADDDGYTTLTLVNALTTALDNAGVTLYKQTEATALITDGTGRVTGVKAVSADGQEIEFTGKTVILATGGFGQNHDMLVQIRPDLANAITDEIAPTTGDGIRMAQELGAKTVDMEYLQTFPHAIYGDTWLPPMAMPGGFMTTAIFVNQDAQRYTTEGFETSADTLQQQAVYCVFNEDDLNDNLKQLQARGFIQSGDTVEELAAALGLEPAALRATVDQWNADCDAGQDSQFDRHNLKPLAGKLYGYRFGVGAHYFMGGLLINERTQVLDENEQPIAGLYAAGETTGGFHGSVRVDGSGVGDAFVFGHLSGQMASQEALG